MLVKIEGVVQQVRQVRTKNGKQIYIKYILQNESIPEIVRIVAFQNGHQQGDSYSELCQVRVSNGYLQVTEWRSRQ